MFRNLQNMLSTELGWKPFGREAIRLYEKIEKEFIHSLIAQELEKIIDQKNKRTRK